MTDHGSPADEAPPDDVVSAVLDGEGTVAEQQLVESSEAGRERLEQLRQVAAQVARPVPPLDPLQVDVMVARALGAAERPRASDGSDAPRHHDPRRSGGRRLARSAGVLVAAAAVLVVLVLGVGSLARSSRSSSSSDAASSATQSSGGDDSGASSAAGSGATAADGSTTALAPPDLGAVADASTALERYLVLRDLEPTFDHQFDGAEERAEESAPQTSAAPASGTADACPLPPVGTEPSDQWTEVATAVLPTGPVVLLRNGATSPAPRVLVVDSDTCAVLLDRPI